MPFAPPPLNTTATFFLPAFALSFCCAHTVLSFSCAPAVPQSSTAANVMISFFIIFFFQYSKT
jgi:hypothetical protein